MESIIRWSAAHRCVRRIGASRLTGAETRIASLAVVLSMAAPLAHGQTAGFSTARPLDASTTSSSAETSGTALGVDEAVRVAVARSRRIVGNTALIEASRGRATAAGKRPDPVFTTGLQSVPFTGADRGKLHNDSFTMTAFGIRQELTSRDKRVARSERYAREADSGEAARSLSVIEIARDTRLAWLACSYLETSADLLKDASQEVAHHIEAVDAAYRGGRGTQGESIAIRAELERIVDRQRQSARDIAVARARLARWVGDAAERPLSARTPLAVRPGLSETPAALELRLEAHPAIRRLVAQEATAQADAELARTERSADWSVELAVGVRRPTYSNLGTINFSIPITWNRAERQDREWAARRSEAEAAGAELEEARRVAAADLRAASDAWQHDLERLVRYDEAFLPLATGRSNAALAAWRGGAGSLAAVLDARHAEIETRLDRLKLERELAETAVQLDYWLAADRRGGGNDIESGDRR